MTNQTVREALDKLRAQAAEIERIKRERGQAVDALREAIGLLENCSVESGVCGCGDDMYNHPSPMGCGHSPTDYGSYVAMKWLEKARTTLASIEGAGHE